MNRKILQIVPAPPGLVTAFFGDGPTPDLYPVVLFALCEVEDNWGNPSQEIVPIDVGGGEVSDPSWLDDVSEDFLGVFAAESPLNRAQLEGANRREAERRAREKQTAGPHGSVSTPSS